MNKIQVWHYEKAKKSLMKEIDEKGLMVRDEKIFDIYTRKVSRKNMIYNFLFIVIIIMIILRWTGVY